MTVAKLRSLAFSRFAIAVAAAALMLIAPVSTRAQEDQAVRSVKLIQNRPASEPFIAIGFNNRFDPVAEPQILRRDSYRLTRIRKGEALKDRFLGVER